MRPGRFHYFRGDCEVQEENGSDAELMERMLARHGMTWSELLRPEVASEYAMGVLTVDERSAELQLFESTPDAAAASAQITLKQFDPGDRAFNLSAAARAEAEAEFRRWAAGRGYEPRIAPTWARPPEP